jgi:glycine cleavage system protein P-like pyridoxal-binding family
MLTILKVYAWIVVIHGGGLKETSEVAVVNNNYLVQNVIKARHESPLDRESPLETAGNTFQRADDGGHWCWYG